LCWFRDVTVYRLARKRGWGDVGWHRERTGEAAGWFRGYTPANMGSTAIAAGIAYVAFPVLLFYGWAIGELSPSRVGVFVLLWFAGLFGLPLVPYEPIGAMFPSFVAVLDIALVFAIFKGDVEIR